MLEPICKVGTTIDGRPQSLLLDSLSMRCTHLARILYDGHPVRRTFGCGSAALD